MLKKYLIVFGTRPEAIKMAPLVKKLQQCDWAEVKVCITAQHRQMLDQVLDIFEIIPDFDLDLMGINQGLEDLTGRILTQLQIVLSDYHPDLVFVHGDTATTCATSLACFFNKVKIAHVEAGLRTNDLMSPWPEEGNRRVTSVLANYHFAPTETAAANLLRENIPSASIFITGNTVIDALLLGLEKIKLNKLLANSVNHSLSTVKLQKKYILVTGHRRENFGRGFEQICDALIIIAKDNPNIDIVYPVHLNPNIKELITRRLGDQPNIKLCDPLNYLEFISIMQDSYLILTDSGGIQEEAPALGKPVLVMREKTERPEGVSAGTVRLVGTSSCKISQAVQTLIDSKTEYQKMSHSINPYGDGNASARILDFLLSADCDTK